jgi:hypothetical protein
MFIISRFRWWILFLPARRRPSRGGIDRHYDAAEIQIEDL